MLDMWIIDGRLMVALVTAAVFSGAAEFAAGFAVLTDGKQREDGVALLAWAELLLGVATVALAMAAPLVFTPF